MRELSKSRTKLFDQIDIMTSAKRRLSRQSRCVNESCVQCTMRAFLKVHRCTDDADDVGLASYCVTLYAFFKNGTSA